MFTPIDIQNHSLKTAVRGYSKKETDDFLEEILKSYEELYKENRDLKDKVSSLSEGIQYYKNMEETLQKALMLAEKTSSETQEAAKSRADSLMSEAETKVTAMQKEAEAEIEALRKETEAYSEVTRAKVNQELAEARDHVRKLVRSYENYRLQFRRLAESQIEMLESEHFKIFEPELTEMLTDAPTADEAMGKGEYRKNVHVIENVENGMQNIQTAPEGAVSPDASGTIPDTIPLPVEELNAVMAEMPQPESQKAEMPQAELPKVEAPQMEAPQVDRSRLNDVQMGNFKTVVPQENISQEEAPQAQMNVPQTETSQAQVQMPQGSVPRAEMPQMSSAPQTQAQVPQGSVPQAEIPQIQAPQVQVPQAEISQMQAPQESVPQQASRSEGKNQTVGLTADDMPPMFPSGTPQASQAVNTSQTVNVPQTNPVSQQPVPQTNPVSQQPVSQTNPVSLQPAIQANPVSSQSVQIPEPAPVKAETKGTSSVQGRQLTADDMPPIPSADDMPPVFSASKPKTEAVPASPFTFIDTE